MKSRAFLKILSQAFYDGINHPLILVPSVVLWTFLILISKISLKVTRLIENPVSIHAWFIIVSFATVFIISLIAAGLIGISESIIRQRKASVSQFLTYTRKFGLRNFVVFIMLTIAGVPVWAVAHYGAFFLGKSFNLGLSSAQTLFILLYFLGIAGFLIFFIFASFYLVIENTSLKKSFVLSWRLVSREYPLVLSTTIIFSILLFFIDKIQGLGGDLILYGILVPIVSLFLTRFVISCQRETVD